MNKSNRYISLTLSLIIMCSQAQAFEWGFAERQGYRQSMEDAHVIENQLDPYEAYAIFDGHGGKEAADIAALQLKLDITMGMSLPSLSDMNDWISQIESKLNMEDITSGTTMITAFIDKKTKLAYLFWVGDARAIVIRDGKVVDATIDHNLKSEAGRLKKANAIVNGNYIRNFLGNGLAVPRTIGDLIFKKSAPAIISDPEMKSVQLHTGDYIVLACDGLWDALSNEDVAAHIHQAQPQIVDDNALQAKGKPDHASSDGDLKALAQSLRDKAFNEGSRDNISVIIVKI